MSHEQEMYSLGNIVNNYSVCMVTYCNWNYHDHFEMYRKITKLCNRNNTVL